MNLYEVVSTLKEYHNHKDVKIRWFVYEREKPVMAYSQAIADYETMPPNQKSLIENALDELFTEDEASKLKGYLENNDWENTEVKKVDLPIGANFYPWGSNWVGGSSDFAILADDDSPLPYRVWGYYNLEDHKPIPRPHERFSVSQFDSQTYVVADDLHENEFCICGAYDEQTLPPETRAALIARFLNSFSEVVTLNEQA